MDMNKRNFKSFVADSGEELQEAVGKWLLDENKRVLTISSYHDSSTGKHYAMIGTNPSQASVQNYGLCIGSHY